jgi:hypothetical protein
MAPERTPEQSVNLDTAALLDACRRWVQDHVIVSVDQSSVLAAWVLHTWAIEAAEYTPYLHITAAEKECGKSQLLETLAAVVYRPCKSEGISPAALLRLLDRDCPTLLLDEVDTIFGGNKEGAESIRGILNTGFKRGGVHRKCTTKSHELQEFKSFGPKAFAGIGKVPDTVASRSIVIEMTRKRPGEQVASFHYRDMEEAKKPLVAALEAWSKSGVVEQLRQARPTFPDGFGDRQKDICEPLLAIADEAGSEWSSTLRQSLLRLFQSEAAEDSSLGITLLRDVRSVFDGQSENDRDRITSAALVAALVALEGSPWADWPASKGFTVSTLANRLKPFHIHPRTIRIGGQTFKGYLRESFSDAWSRYFPNLPEVPCQTVTAVTMPEIHAEGGAFQASQSPRLTAQELFGNERDTRFVTAVTPVTAPEQRKPKPLVEGVL